MTDRYEVRQLYTPCCGCGGSLYYVFDRQRKYPEPLSRSTRQDDCTSLARCLNAGKDRFACNKELHP